jgi:hypothetical protein
LCVQIELLFNLEFNTVYVVLLFRRSSLWRWNWICRVKAKSVTQSLPRKRWCYDNLLMQSTEIWSFNVFLSWPKCIKTKYTCGSCQTTWLSQLSLQEKRRLLLLFSAQ